MRAKFKDEKVVIRTANKEDMVLVAEMCQELANSHNMPDGLKISTEDLMRDGFERSPPSFRCKVAVVESTVAGYALYFPTYSWEGRAMMLEDLYVRSALRRLGLGERLFRAVAKEASSEGCSRLDFHVLEWNNARSFYEGLGAVNLTNKEQWCYYRLAEDALKNVAGK